MQKTCCKYYNGSTRHTHCEADVFYRAVTPDPDGPGSVFREPCRKVDDWSSPRTRELAAAETHRGHCPHFTEPTAEEIATYEAEFAAAMNRLALAGPIIDRIKKQHKGQNWHGLVVCPACQGRLHMTHAGLNGHVSGRCETEDCMSWMQ